MEAILPSVPLTLNELIESFHRTITTSLGDAITTSLNVAGAGAGAGPKALSTIVIYEALLPFPGAVNQIKEDISVTLSGRCWSGTTEVECDARLLGRMTSSIIPLLLTYPIFCGLCFFTLISMVIYNHYNTPPPPDPQSELELDMDTSPNPDRLPGQRWKTVDLVWRSVTLMMALQASMAMLVAVLTSCSLILLPLFDTDSPTSPDHIIAVRPGWGFIITIILMITFCFFLNDMDVRRYPTIPQRDDIESLVEWNKVTQSTSSSSSTQSDQYFDKEEERKDAGRP
nr:uncharacterized protein CI109_004449 [Kwoniella shandongensis]KAA5527157.1 hypothetical protein CI109_004449 [Kwoniella shandongensis]